MIFSLKPPWNACLQNLLKNKIVGNVWFEQVDAGKNDAGEDVKIRRKPIIIKAITEVDNTARNSTEPESEEKDKYLMRV